MRTISGSGAAWLAANNVTHRADLYTLTLLDGTIYRWTSFEYDLVAGGNTFRTAGANGPLVTRGLYRQNLGLVIDTLDLTLVGGSFTVGGKSLSLLAAQGWFNGARMQVDHVIMATPGDVSRVISSFFEGRVAAEPKGAAVVLRVKSELVALNVAVPKFPLRPQCGNAVYDVNCGLSRAAFTDTGTASGTLSTTQVQSTTAAVIARATAYYEPFGVLKFTSGVNAGLRRAVQKHVLSGGVATLTLAIPLPSAPGSGDAFTVYPGCDRSQTMCKNKFANSNTASGQNRSFQHIPNPESGS